jgi:hypothetical protein
MSTQITSSKNQSIGFMDFTRLEAAIECCKMIAKASFCPAPFRGKPEEVLCSIQYGMEIGYSPMQALQSIAVINGKPSVYGDGLMALCQSFSECEDIQETFDVNTMAATCTVKRKGRSPVISTWNPEKAKKAGLWGKSGPWSQYPERMLQMRARGFALRDAFADRLKGIITAEEARDYPVVEEKSVSVGTSIKSKDAGNFPLPKAEPILPETKDHLMFLIGELQLSDEVRAQWFNKLKISSLDELSETKAQREIQKIESKHPEAAKLWIEIAAVRQEFDESEITASALHSSTML